MSAVSCEKYCSIVTHEVFKVITFNVIYIFISDPQRVICKVINRILKQILRGTITKLTVTCFTQFTRMYVRIYVYKPLDA